MPNASNINIEEQFQMLFTMNKPMVCYGVVMNDKLLEGTIYFKTSYNIIFFSLYK